MAGVELYERLGDLIAGVVESARLSIVRVAGVTEYFRSPDAVPPALLLATHFFKPEFLKAPFNRPETLEVHSHKVYEFSDFKVNSWVRVKNVALDGPPSGMDADVVLFHSDINTLAESTQELTTQRIRKFFALLSGEILRVRRLYFPHWEE
jgi:hypothetical protein